MPQVTRRPEPIRTSSLAPAPRPAPELRPAPVPNPVLVPIQVSDQVRGQVPVPVSVVIPSRDSNRVQPGGDLIRPVTEPAISVTNRKSCHGLNIVRGDWKSQPGAAPIWLTSTWSRLRPPREDKPPRNPSRPPAPSLGTKRTTRSTSLSRPASSRRQVLAPPPVHRR